MTDDSRIHLLNNGISDRQKKKVGAQNATLDELAALGNQVRADTQAECIKVCEWYMSQLPGLVAKMLGDGFAAHGIVMQPPPSREAQRALSSAGAYGETYTETPSDPEPE